MVRLTCPAGGAVSRPFCFQLPGHRNLRPRLIDPIRNASQSPSVPVQLRLVQLSLHYMNMVEPSSRIHLTPVMLRSINPS